MTGEATIHFVKRLAAILVVQFCSLLMFAETRSDSLTIHDFREVGIPLYKGNEVKLLVTGVQKFDDMFSAIRQARKYIHLDYFKFQEDSICTALFDILQQKTREGVQVRVVYDSFANKISEHPLTDSFLNRVRAAGIEIHEFDRVKFPWINHFFHRNHHKIAVIDGEVCYTGGMNVADYYLHGKPRVGEWRDMHIRLHGPIVLAYEQVFANMWETVTGELLDGDFYKGNNISQGGTLVALADRVPTFTPAIMRQIYCISIDNAQHLVQIVNPYLTLVGEVKRALMRAIDRGVRVQIMVSTVSDGTANMDVVGIEVKQLMKRGAEIFYYNGGFHHSKFMMVDGLFCTVGTTNLDARSLRFDYEVNSIIFSPQTTTELQQVFEKDVRERCTFLTPKEWKVRFPLKRRIRSRMYMLSKPFL